MRNTTKIIFVSILLFLPLSVAFSADLLQALGEPADLDVAGFNHIQWQKVQYSQGDCPELLTGIAYWSPGDVFESAGDAYYTPYVQIHGGGWFTKKDYEPVTEVGDAEKIQAWVEKGYILFYPTYRGAEQVADPNEFPGCDHPRELIRDAEFFLQAIAEGNEALPQGTDIRPQTLGKIRMGGGSAGAHVAMSLAVRNPSWFDRVLGEVGIYDFRHLADQWEESWESFGNRNLDECDAEFDNKVTATTTGIYGQVGPAYNLFEVTQRNCGKLPVLGAPGAYRVTDSTDPAKWAEFGAGTFVELEEEDPEPGEDPRKYTIFFAAHFLNPVVFPLLASSEIDNSLPDFDHPIIVQEISAGSVPVLPTEEAREQKVGLLRSVYLGFLDGYLNQSFLDLQDPNHPLLLDNTLGEFVRANPTAEYPQFRLTTNTGDFTLQEQALAFCNDLQDLRGLPLDKVLAQDAKGTIYQCGDTGLLSIATGGDHGGIITTESYYVRWPVERESHLTWLRSEADPTPTGCGFLPSPLTNWVAGAGALADWYLESNFFATRNGSGLYDPNIYANEWAAIINDPLYRGTATTRFPLFIGEGMIASRDPVIQATNNFFNVHKLCVEPM